MFKRVARETLGETPWKTLDHRRPMPYLVFVGNFFLLRHIFQIYQHIELLHALVGCRYFSKNCWVN